MPEDVPLGTLLRRHRRAAGMTLEEAAETSGVSARAISDMERGRTRAPQRRTLRSLVDALGVTPPDRDAVFAAAAAARERRAPWVSGFCELPCGAADFAARASEMAALEKMAVGSVVPISGPPGTGKTTLAIRAAEFLGGAFRDGCFFVDLRGLSDQPLGPAEAASRLLRALGVAEYRVPAGQQDRAERLRGLLRQRRTLPVDHLFRADLTQPNPPGTPSDPPGPVRSWAWETTSGRRQQPLYPMLAYGTDSIRNMDEVDHPGRYRPYLWKMWSWPVTSTSAT